MSEEHDKVAGGCHCGAVRYEVVGSPVYVPYCHCESCRKTSGAPVVMYVMFERPQVRFTKGDRKFYRSSATAERGFCGDCGTPLTWESDWGGKTVTEVHISTLDNPEQFPPDRHVFHAERLSWFDVADRLPRYSGTSVNTAPVSHKPSVEI